MSLRFLRLLLLGLIVSFAVSLPSLRAEDDLEDEIQVDLDEPEDSQVVKPVSGSEETPEEEEETEGPLKSSPDAETTVLFTQPPARPTELPAGKHVHLLVGFTNRGTEQDFVVERLEASLRYALDFNFHIQNFSTAFYEQTVRPKEQTTLHYTFYPNEGFSSRPFGLVLLLHYRDGKGQQYMDAVFNETVTIVEVDEGLDGETFFLYVLLGAIVILLLLGGHQLVTSLMKKKGGSTTTVHHHPKIEMGTQNDVDYDWIPPEALNEIRKSPKERQSPRQRKSTRSKPKVSS